MATYKKVPIITGAVIISALFLWVLISPCTAFAGTYETALQGYWKFDEGSGTTTADSAGTRNGTLYYGTSWAQGRFGGALSFDRTQGQYVDFGNGFKINADGYTISALVKNPSGGYAGIVDIMQDPSHHVMLETNWGAYSVYHNQAYGSPFAAGTYNDAWQLVTIVSESDSVQKVYVNGVLKQTYDLSGYPEQNFTGRLKIGVNPYDENYYSGLIDDVAIWNRALSASEIGSINKMGVEGFELLYGNLSYTPTEMAQLNTIYGTEGAKTTIGKIEWTYTTASFGPGHNIGDAWTENGKYYIKLGSGYIGEDTTIPEPATAMSILGGLFMVASRRLLKRRIK